MRNRRLHRSPRGWPHPHRGPPAPRVPRLRLRRDRPRGRVGRACSSRRGPASSSTCRRRIADRTPHAALGLAHTRWATHGRPNDLNAHPHQDCTGDITVIHNGIIENFQELRDGLEARGHTLTSETDTEAIAHLVEEAYRGDLADAVRTALRRTEGAYALVVMHRSEISRLVGARQNVPLVVGPQRRGELHRERRRGDPRPHQPHRLPRGGRRRGRAADRRRGHGPRRTPDGARR